MLGPAGYGLPLVPGAEVGERELALMVLKRADEPAARIGIAGMRTIIRALIAAGIPLVFGPGAIHLPTVPDHRKWNRIDLGTADKVASAALGIADQAERLGIPYDETSFVMLELGGGFSAALAVDARADRRRPRRLGRPDRCACVRRARRRGGLSDRRRAVEADACSAEGRSTPMGKSTSRHRERSSACVRTRAARDGWRALEEGAAKAVLALTASVPAPREILVAGRLAATPGLLDALADRLGRVAPVRPALAARSAARGAALLADGLAGGSYAPLVSCLRLRDARGGVLDHLRMYGAERIVLG